MTCPEIFEANCANRDEKCDSCRAITGTGKLFYRPLSRKLRDVHPATDLEAKARGKSSNKRGRKVEAQLTKDFGLVTTEASGAKFRDGDGKLVLNNGDEITISVKSRTTSLKLGLSAKEYKVDEIHLINSKDYGTVVIMSKLVFDQLIDGYKSSSEGIINKDVIE